MPVLTAAPWQCGNCHTMYALWLSRCQRCHGPGPTEEEPLVPKITRASGPSGASAEAHKGEEVPDPVVVAPAPTPEDNAVTDVEAPEQEDDDEPDHEAAQEPSDTPEGGEGAAVGDPATESGDAEGTDPEPEAPRHPIVNDLKSVWVDYAASEAIGLNRQVAEDEYSKADLIKVVGRIEAGTAVVVDGRVLDDPF